MAGVTWRDGVKAATNVLFEAPQGPVRPPGGDAYCNLECTYCNEFDKVSKPVPLAGGCSARIDALARLNVQIVTLTGGEP